jgi:drug/metabolite transporter (DMT)-like permease
LVGSIFIWTSIIAGALLSATFYFYYASIRASDVSTVVPVFSTAPLFTLLFGFLFLGERFGLSAYIGIACIVLGAVTISAKHLRRHLTFDRAALLAFGVAIASAARSALIKYPAEQTTIWPLLFWIGLGSALAATPIFIWHYGHINIHSKRRFRIGMEHLLIIDLFDALALLSLMIAIGLGPVSLVTAILHTKPLIIFVTATVLSVFFPRYLHERITTRILSKKIAGTLLIIMGAMLIVS